MWFFLIINIIWIININKLLHVYTFYKVENCYYR